MNMNNTQTATEIVAEANRACMNGTCGVLNNVTFDEIEWYYNKYYKTRDNYITATATFLVSFVGKMPIKELAGAVISNISAKYYKNICLVDAIDYLLNSSNQPDITEVIKHLKGERELCVPAVVVESKPVYIEDKSNTDTNIGDILNNIDLNNAATSAISWLEKIFSNVKKASDISSTSFDEKMSQLEKDAEEEIKNLNITAVSSETTPAVEDKTETVAGQGEEKVTTTNSGINKEIPDKPFMPLNKDINIKLEETPNGYKARNGSIIILDGSTTNMWLEEKVISANDYKSICDNIEKCSNQKPLLIHVLMIHYFNKHYGVNAIPYAVKEDAVYVSVGNINTVLKIPYYSNKAIRMNIHASKQPTEKTA